MYLELIWNTKIMCSKEGRRLTYLYFLFLISFLYKYIHLFLDIKKLVFFLGIISTWNICWMVAITIENNRRGDQ